MTFLYRLLGIAARIGERLSHTRVNLVPFNWAVMFILGVVFATGLNGIRDAAVNGQTPRAVSLNELLDHKDVDHNYVKVSGLVFPKARIVRRSKKSGSVSQTWVPIVPPGSDRALLVKVASDGSAVGDGEPHAATLVGMLVPMSTDLQKKLNDEIAGLPAGDVPKIDTTYELVENRHPGSPLLWTAMAVLGGGALALMLATFAMKYVVFRRTPGVALENAANPPAFSGDLRVTGKFILDPKNQKRFLNVPAGLARLDGGQIALVSNIDASDRFMGFTTQKRAGMWAIVFPPLAPGDVEAGELYCGLAAYPSLRIRYRDEQSGQASTAVLSCADDGDRAYLYRALLTPGEPEPAPHPKPDVPGAGGFDLG